MLSSGPDNSDTVPTYMYNVCSLAVYDASTHISHSHSTQGLTAPDIKWQGTYLHSAAADATATTAHITFDLESQETLALAALVRDKAKVAVVAAAIPVEDGPMLDHESSGSGEEEEDCLAKMLLVGV